MTLESIYEKLIEYYTELRKSNEQFLIDGSSMENFENLIDKRTAIFDEINNLREDLVKEISTLYIDLDYDNMELFEILRELPRFYPNLSDYKKRTVEALKKLMASEENVSDDMTEQRDDLKREINQARASKKTLSAYKPSSGYAGSHFIDRKK